ncbi:hypothetical protein CAter282_1654 [Collimonas arenae]|uniref:Uncharacterized protein n=1 Tax=Collimonas arenae TaxID=279058 RepID=A0A127QHG8_9BURK|nr:hypothetical protein CAter10_1783 [Collimonas arenae]AMP09436.1 hypothetical protein CAter282_1654 [Collimonas arenae]
MFFLICRNDMVEVAESAGAADGKRLYFAAPDPCYWSSF